MFYSDMIINMVYGLNFELTPNLQNLFKEVEHYLDRKRML